MMRRYSRPRHLIPGCTRPLRPRAMKLIGFSTPPSPPAAGGGPPHPAAPPPGARRLAAGVGDVDRAAVGSLEPLRVGGEELVAAVQVPRVVAIDEDAELRREDVERREAQVRDPTHWPYVAAVRLHVALDVLKAITLRAGQLGDIEPARSGAPERLDRGDQARMRGTADGGVLALDQLHRLRRPGKQ